MRPLTTFQLGLIEIMQMPDTKVEISTRKRSRVTGKKTLGVDGPVAKAFRERHNWEGSLSLKSMGKELWTTYQKYRYHYYKYGTFDNFEEK